MRALSISDISPFALIATPLVVHSAGMKYVVIDFGSKGV
jgi:hypothetical protein